MKHFYILCCFLLSGFTIQAQEWKSHADSSLLQGKWQDDRDSAYVLVITGYHFVEYYGGLVIDSALYELMDYSCDTEYMRADIQNVSFLKKYNAKGNFCYEITSITDTTLSIRRAATGTMTVFRRRKK